MKHLNLITASLLLAVLCFSTACQGNNQATGSKETQSEKILDEEKKELIEQSLKSFRLIDENQINSAEEYYIELLTANSDTLPSKEDLQWFRKNVTYVDSISKYGLSLLEDDKYIELQNLFDKEWGNFLSHPNTDTYLWYDLIVSLLYLYQVNGVPNKELYEKMAGHLELFIIRTEFVQSGWDAPHPLYKPALEDLKLTYKYLGNKAKVTEIESKLNALN